MNKLHENLKASFVVAKKASDAILQLLKLNFFWGGHAPAYTVPWLAWGEVHVKVLK